MRLTIELPDDQEAVLQAKAREQGVSTEQYVKQMLAHDLEPGGRSRRHISEVIQENMRDVPSELLAALPEDGASEHDHYIYGSPKKNQ